MPINYVKGDATYPIGDGPKVIVHCVNDIGKFGSGFALAVANRWPNVKQEYLKWHNGHSSMHYLPFELGQVQFVEVDTNLWVANMIGQHKTIREVAVPIRYEAFEQGLQTVADFCKRNSASLHSCRLGSGLARGHWPTIEKIIENKVCNVGVKVTVYDL